jgi:hypothetical protein
MPSDPRSPGTRTSRRHGTHRVDDTWVPGTLPEGDGAGAAALEELHKRADRSAPDLETAAGNPADDDRPLGELADDLAEWNGDVSPADPDDEEGE